MPGSPHHAALRASRISLVWSGGGRTQPQRCALRDEPGHMTVPADCHAPGESERHAGREVGRTGWRRKPPTKPEKFGARWTDCQAPARPHPWSLPFLVGQLAGFFLVFYFWASLSFFLSAFFLPLPFFLPSFFLSFFFPDEAFSLGVAVSSSGVDIASATVFFPALAFFLAAAFFSGRASMVPRQTSWPHRHRYWARSFLVILPSMTRP